MGVIGNPFKLFGRILVAGFLIAEYTVTFIIQGVGWVKRQCTHQNGFKQLSGLLPGCLFC